MHIQAGIEPYYVQPVVVAVFAQLFSFIHKVRLLYDA